MDDFFVVFSTMGEMNIQDILAECRKQKWCPIVVIRNGDQVTIPCFTDNKTAIQFAKRNIPQHQVWGTTTLTPEDILRLKKDWVEGKGWKLEYMSFPKKMTDRGQLDVEIHYFEDNPDIGVMIGSNGKLCRGRATNFKHHFVPDVSLRE